MKTIYEFLKNKTISTQDAEYVDLGLPSGLLWAKCNIGGKEPTDYGYYFMWGSTEPNTHKSCNWKNCPFNDGESQFNDEYFESIKNKICKNGNLIPEYDAACVILGDDWRLPTEGEFKELIDNTKHEWVENYQGSVINGMLFTSKNNDAELFIPASGWRVGSGFYHRGNNANLWSSSLNTIGENCANYFYFDDSSCHMYYEFRDHGFCLRGVKEK